jgi:hypothetical protein
MPDFAKRIDSPYGRLVFSFTVIHTVNGLIYHISVFKGSAHFYFHMEKRNGSWQIVESPRAALWLYDYEEELAKIILEKSLA